MFSFDVSHLGISFCVAPFRMENISPFFIFNHSSYIFSFYRWKFYVRIHATFHIFDLPCFGAKFYWIYTIEFRWMKRCKVLIPSALPIFKNRIQKLQSRSIQGLHQYESLYFYALSGKLKNMLTQHKDTVLAIWKNQFHLYQMSSSSSKGKLNELDICTQSTVCGEK